MGVLKTWYIFVALVSLAINNHAKFNFAKKRITFLKVQTCPGHNMSSINVTINKYNRTVQMFNVELYIADDLDDTKTMQFELRRWSDGGWKHNFIQIEKSNFCTTAFVLMRKGLEEFLRKIGKEPSCPIKKGYYHVNNLTLNISETPLAISTGKFLAIIKASDKNKNTFFCAEYYVDTEEA